MAKSIVQGAPVLNSGTKSGLYSTGVRACRTQTLTKPALQLRPHVRACVHTQNGRQRQRSTELAGVPVRRSIHLISRRTIQGELALGASLAWLGPSPSRPCYDGRDNANNWCEDPLKKMVRGGNGQGRESCSSPWTWTG